MCVAHDHASICDFEHAATLKLNHKNQLEFSIQFFCYINSTFIQIEKWFHFEKKKNLRMI